MTVHAYACECMCRCFYMCMCVHACVLACVYVCMRVCVRMCVFVSEGEGVHNMLPFRRLGIFVLSIDAPVHSAV